MIHSTDYDPRVFPYKGTQDPNQIDRVQDMTVSATLNRAKIEEVGRDGIIDWKVGNPSLTLTLKQLEYGNIQFFRDLANTASTDTKIDFKDYETSQVDIAGYETDENSAFKSTVWYSNYRLSGFSVNIGNPDAIVERNFTLVGEEETVLQGDNKYLIVDKQTASGGSSESFTLDDPTPVLDPDNSGQYLFKVVRYNNSDSTTEELKYEAGAGDPALGTDYYTYSGGTLKVHTSADDVIKSYYSAGSYVAGESTFTNNDSDAAALLAESCSVYLQSTNYIYRLQSVGVDVSFDRYDVREIGDKDVVQRGLRDVTCKITLGRILDQWTIEEVLRGEVSGYGKLDIREYTDELSLVIKIYSDDKKTVFRTGYKFTDLAPVGVDDGTPLNDYVTRGVTLEGEAGFVTSDVNEL